MNDVEAGFIRSMSATDMTFTPSLEIYKEYLSKDIYALHIFTDGDEWLLRFDTANGEWKRVREATQVDKEFFKWNAMPTTANEVAFYRSTEKRK